MKCFQLLTIPVALAATFQCLGRGGPETLPPLLIRGMLQQRAASGRHSSSDLGAVHSRFQKGVEMNRHSLLEMPRQMASSVERKALNCMYCMLNCCMQNCTCPERKELNCTPSQSLLYMKNTHLPRMGWRETWTRHWCLSSGASLCFHLDVAGSPPGHCHHARGQPNPSSSSLYTQAL